ncbi:Olfactory receptor 1002 [Myotis davidii]|uniref:Olfactory receptor 1002 n=1 Tax=Myotis davidii TaxID=225400 RepID=L5MBP9_MYODS|nr:Olfactory receptor 1002 [Myotis davidii]
MAYDRYIAICNPLLYTVIVSQRVCVQLVAVPYAMGILNAIIQETFTFCLPFCGPNVVNHFFCDILPVLSLACADTQNKRLLLFILAGAIVLFSGMIIAISYVCILVVILKIQTADGRQKAFSTCSSHLAAICILYGTLFFNYVLPDSGSSIDINKVISLFYTVVIPMLNPLIYSLRNKEFVVTECFLLASMAYDRYMAICKPLLYTLIMSQQVCVQLVVGPYTMGLISAMTHTTFAFRLPYCGPKIINHFFCDLLPVLSLACADTQANKFLLFILAGALGVLSGLIILVSYIYIIITILKIRSADGRCKAFSTCSSHLTAVSILYGTLFFIYVCPSSGSSLDINKVVSVFYTAMIPMLNPLIYSLRNKEVKDSLRRMFERKKFLMSR